MRRYALIFLFAAGLTLTGWLCFRSSAGADKRTREYPALATAPQISNSAAAARTQITNSTEPAPAAASASVVSPAEKAEPQAFVEFSRWAQQFMASDGAGNIGEGQALAWKRREALRELIQTAPEQALKEAAPYRWRRELPAKVTRFLEQQVDGRGTFLVAMATDYETKEATVSREVTVGTNRFDTFVYGRRNSQISQENIPIHGIAVDNQLALQAEPIRVLEPDEVQARLAASPASSEEICGVTGLPAQAKQNELVADVCGNTVFFCSPEHVALVRGRLVKAESGKGGSPGGTGAQPMVSSSADNWTHGPKSVLYMRLNFPDDLTEPISEAGAYSAMNGVNFFYTESSYNETSMDPTVTPLLTLPHTKWYYSSAGAGALLGDARDLARRSGYDTANYDRDIAAFTSVPDYNFGGLAFIGAKGVWLQSMGVGVSSHELGHNHGLFHANSWYPLVDSSIIGAGTNVEYGDIFDTMGSAVAGANHFNAIFKNILQWLPDTSVHNITTNGVYRIFPFDSPNRVNGRYYAGKIRKDFSRDYWLEFHQKFNSNPWMQNGVLLNWSSFDQSNGGSEMLDTTPGSPTPSDDSRDDAALTIGRTFDDPGAGVHITPLGRGMTDTNIWVDVQVNLGYFVGNQPPELRIEVDPPNPSPGSVMHFHAVATDADGDALAYAWSFDDLTFSTNNLPWTFKSWSTPGDHLVRCVVSDMKGGIASANTLVTLGPRSGYRISGRVLDLEGEPVEGVRVNNAPTNFSNYIGGYTDSQGRFIILNGKSDEPLQAVKYGYTFTNLNWTSPISMTSDIVHVDFVAIPSTAITITSTTNSIPENSTQTNYLTLSRTGSTNADLSVSVNLSGTATLGQDYTLTPPLVPGSNSIVIPAGAYDVTFVLKTINDSVAEGTETVELTVLEEVSYVAATPAIAAITIVDDDLQALPLVSITPLIASVPENGADSGRFLLTRKGSTQFDLAVSYTVSGSATPGVDYTPLLGVAVIPAGATSTTIQFKPIDDKDVEGDETVMVTLASQSTYSIGVPSAQIVIRDDDFLVVTVYPTAGDAAEPSKTGRFTVKRDGDFSGNVVVNYAVSGTAVAGADYVPLSGSVTIPSGQPSADITLTPVDDTLLEGDKTVTVTLTNGPGYDVGTPGTASIIIHDNEKPSVSITAPDNMAAEQGYDTAMFVVSRSGGSTGDLTVYLGISGSALNGIDYIPIDSTVVIPNGSSSLAIEIVPFDDLQRETTENVLLNILPSTNYNVGSPNEAEALILDDDDSDVPAVGFCLAASSAEENRSPGICVSLSYTSTVPITVDYKVIGGTASPSDYSLPPGPLMIPAGDKAALLGLHINDNTISQPNRTIRLALYNPTNATLDGIKIHTYTIVDDDSASVTVAATTATAQEAGPVAGNFRITRAGSTAQPLLVNFQLTGTASAPTDYAPLGTSVTIPAGASFVDLPVVPVNDPTVELNQTVVITLSSAPGATIVSPNKATVTIIDNDPNAAPVVAVVSTNHPAAVEGGANGEFTFYRSSTAGPLTVYFAITGTATPGADYTTLPNSITFADGQASVSLAVVAVDDSIIEPEETVVLALDVRDTYRAAYPASVVVRIQDNDQRVRLEASDFVAAEPGTDTGEFTFTRFGTTNADLQVFFTITGTALNGVDYAVISNSFVIPAGSLAATLKIVPLNDQLVEGPETVTLTLMGAGYALDAQASGTVTINDDEPMLTISATVSNVVEGSKQPGVFTITRTGDPRYEFTAHLAIGGTATYGVDYPPFFTNLYFPCGALAINLQVFPTNELMLEPTETVTARLLPDPAYTILSPSNAVINIIDAGTNTAPSLAIASPTANMVFLIPTSVGIILEAPVSDTTGTNLNLAWTNVAGPDSLVFGDPTNNNTTVVFTNAGVYTLRLTADDGDLTNFADVIAVVGPTELFATNLLHWSFDDGAGTNVLDSSGAGRNGVATGAPVWLTNAVLGGGLRLFGTNDCVQLTNGPSVLDGLRAFTISLWLNSAATNGDQALFCADDATTNTTLVLNARATAGCGVETNVIEALFATTRGQVRRTSAAGVLTNGWQHIALTWSNGLAPALFVNGRLDQPFADMVPLSGVLTNCPRFIVGKGGLSGPPSFNGWLDDVRLFERALSAAEVAALASLPPTNYGAIVDAGTNTTLQLTSPATLVGTVTDDGKPIPPGVVSNTWTLASGPVPATLTNANSLTNIVDLDTPGQYIFRLIGDDGQVKVFDDVTVTMIEPTLVDVVASDPDAAELGPDTGEFTFVRHGDINFDLPVYLSFSGTASNGADFPAISSLITFPAGTDTVVVAIAPYLDHRIEGDEPFTISLVSNLAYTIGNPQATVTIHDSSYGVWSIAHFTLEELTLPNRSGEGADFDHDGLSNFAEYAANLDPKAADTNGPIKFTFELDPTDNTNHLFFTFHRRIAPTDTGYLPVISNDLVTWNSGTNYLQEIQATDDGNLLTETVKIRVVAPLSQVTNQFVTVKVWLEVTGPP